MATILVMDDELLLTNTLVIILTKAGHKVLTASDGRTGIQIYDRERPDLVILDIMMPVMDGFEVLKVLRAETSDVPIIVISGGRANLAFLQMVKKLGANIALAKPFSNEQLLEAIFQCLPVETKH